MATTQTIGGVSAGSLAGALSKALSAVPDKQKQNNSLGFDLNKDYDKDLTQWASEIKSGDYTHLDAFNQSKAERNNKIDYLNSTGTNKYNAVKSDYGVNVPTTSGGGTQGTSIKPKAATSKDSDSDPGYMSLADIGKMVADSFQKSSLPAGSAVSTAQSVIEPYATGQVKVDYQSPDKVNIGFDLNTDYDTSLAQWAEEIKNGDYTHLNDFYNYSDARILKTDYLNKTGTNKFGAVYNDYGLLKDGVVNAPTAVYKMTQDANGGKDWTTVVNGVVTLNRDGTRGYSYSNGSQLENGDAVEVNGDFMFYDAESGNFVPQSEWLQKYHKTDPSKYSQEDLLTYLMDMLYSNYSDPTELEDFLSWAEASAIAGERYNPIYEQSVNTAMDSIDKKALASGFYGQLPTEALRQQAVASAEAEKTAAINDLARSLMNDDRDTALAKFQAALDAKQIDMDSILQLIALAQQYGQDGSTLGTTGMQAGQSPIIGYPGQPIDVNGNAVNPSAIGNAPAGTQAAADTQNVQQTVVQPTDTQPKKTANPTPAAKNPTYDNGNLTNAQVKNIQTLLGVTADGMYGESTKKATGGLSAAEAYKQLNDTTFTKLMNDIINAFKGKEYYKARDLYYGSGYDKLTDLQQMTLNHQLLSKGYNPARIEDLGRNSTMPVGTADLLIETDPSDIMSAIGEEWAYNQSRGLLPQVNGKTYYPYTATPAPVVSRQIVPSGGGGGGLDK